MSKNAMSGETMKSAASQHVGLRPRHLYVVPDRKVTRRRYVQPGRTLHLVDLENLMGGPFAGRAAIRRAVREYRAEAGVAAADLVVVATNPALLVEAAVAWSGGGRFLAGGGEDGADLALLDVVQDACWIAERFDRVVIGSGDGLFSDAAAALRRLGVVVGVVARHGRMSRRLAASSTYQRLLPALDHEQEAA